MLGFFWLLLIGSALKLFITIISNLTIGNRITHQWLMFVITMYARIIRVRCSRSDMQEIN